MSEYQIDDAVTPQLHVVADPEKGAQEQLELPNEKVVELVVDADAKGYVDHTVVIDEETNKRLRKMINWRILPCMWACYLGQALDKGALTTASIMGLQADTGMVGQDYALATTTLWIGIIAGEFPANRIAQMAPLGKLLSGALITWGIILLIMGFMRNEKAILGLRFLLGFTESVVGPSLLALSVMWYKRSEQIYVVGFYISSYGLGSVISALLGYGFYQVHTPTVYTWQVLFIVIAGISIIMGICVGIFLPDSPPRAKCFSEHDKLLMTERVRANEQGIKNPKWNWDQFHEAISDVYVWSIVCIAFINSLVVGGISTFQALLINQAFGFNVADSQLLQMPLGNFQVVLYMTSVWLAHRYRQSILILLCMNIPNIVGTIVLLTVTPSASTRGGLLVAFYIMQAYQAQTPLMYQLCSRNVAGQTKRVFAYAAIFTANATGNAIAPQIFNNVWAPRYLISLYIYLGLYGAEIINLLWVRWLLIYRNKKKDANQASSGITHLHAFEDLTDKQNPDYRYVL